MAFKTEEARTRVHEMVKAGKLSNAEIAQLMDGQCNVADVGNVRYALKKAGKISGGGGHSGTKKKSESATLHTSKDAPEIVNILKREEQRLRDRITSFDNVLEAYKGSKDGSVLRMAIEEEIGKTNDRLDVVVDLLASYDETKQ